MHLLRIEDRSSGRGDGPRERLDRLGPRALSDSELLSLLLRTGRPGQSADELARRILREVGGLAAVASEEFASLQGVVGLGPAKSASLVGACEIGRRIATRRLDTPEPMRNLNP